MIKQSYFFLHFSVITALKYCQRKGNTIVLKLQHDTGTVEIMLCVNEVYFLYRNKQFKPLYSYGKF